MMKLHRRELLRALGYGAVVLIAPSTARAHQASTQAEETGQVSFRHGVASGDPQPNAVILWTRVTPENLEESELITVGWEVSLDPNLSTILAEGTVDTGPARDFTVKLDLQGLEPRTTYYYRFRVGGTVSPIGRTRTAPEGPVERLRFAVVACSSLAHGYFHAYRAISERLDLDAVLHLGDYIYEYGTGGYGWIRDYEPSWEIVTLEDYRTRYSQYRRDPDLQEVHRQHPFITVWDDHETANNAWREGAGNHQSWEEGEFIDRKAAAAQAYAEWMPIREQANGVIFRSLRYGDLAELFMLDTRIHGRDLQVERVTSLERRNPLRSILGEDQEAWLGEGLANSTARWKIVGQQVILGQLPPGVNMDAWDGYPAARERFFDMIESAGVQNVVVLSGDSHTSWGMDLARNPYDRSAYDRDTGAGALAVEFAVPGVTSSGLEARYAGLARVAMATGPHIQYGDVWRRGYLVLDLSETRVQGAWFHYADVSSEERPTEALGGVLTSEAGQPHLVPDDDLAPEAPAPAAAP